MSNYQIIEKEVISNVEVLDEIKKKAKDSELTYREEKTLDNLKKYTKLTMTNYKKAYAELQGHGLDRLENEHFVKLLEIMPKDGTELRAVASHSGTVLVDEDAEKILTVLKKYN